MKDLLQSERHDDVAPKCELRSLGASGERRRVVQRRIVANLGPDDDRFDEKGIVWNWRRDGEAGGVGFQRPPVGHRAGDGT